MMQRATDNDNEIGIILQMEAVSKMICKLKNLQIRWGWRENEFSGTAWDRRQWWTVQHLFYGITTSHEGSV
jgi:hypothetical protein